RAPARQLPSARRGAPPAFGGPAPVHPGRAGVGVAVDDGLEGALGAFDIAVAPPGHRSVDVRLGGAVDRPRLPLGPGGGGGRGGGGGQRSRRFGRHGRRVAAGAGKGEEGQNSGEGAAHEPPPGWAEAEGLLVGAGAGAAGAGDSFGARVLTSPSGQVTSGAMEGLASLRTG